MEPRTVTMRFPADRASISSVRHWAQRVIEELGLGNEELISLTGDVKVVLSELATNGVVHGCEGGRPDVTLDAALGLTENGALRVCISDPGAGLPEMRAVDREAVGGRGLALVLALTDRFGVDSPARGGKSVWAEFDLLSPARAASATTVTAAAARADRRRRTVPAPPQDPVALERIPAA
ncbi:ATP-binding protein [Kitasatospora sp. NPDC058162]|uniref:ATP-binding protein n=1 Tax=Kitasatospora sp. NPDC058162 TaxID=3346362 RepID=UPI0036D99826